MVKLGVNIDHIATLRNARGTSYPDPIEAAVLVQLAGASQITVHLREDRRHIRDRDVFLLKDILQIPLNLEMAVTSEMQQIALKVKPSMVTLVPEKREEKTTEGGLNLTAKFEEIFNLSVSMKNNHIPVSLFIEPSRSDIDLALRLQVPMLEFHTGKYSECQGEEQKRELNVLQEAAHYATQKGLIVHAGHGLNYTNVAPIAKIDNMNDLNIGHSIIARASLVGLERAVKDMLHLIEGAK